MVSEKQSTGRNEQEVAKESVSTDVEHVLRSIDLSGEVPKNIREEPGVFLRDVFECWHANGGVEGGRYYRNSIRRMRTEWLVGSRRIKSLHPKLTGRTRLKRWDAELLLDLFLTRWRYDPRSKSANSVSADGYIEFSSKDPSRLKEALLNAFFDEDDESIRRGVLLAPPRKQIESGRQAHGAQEFLVEDQFRHACGIVTLSRNRTLIGPTPSETMKNFWYLCNSFYEVDKKNGSDGKTMIWVVDLGTRTAEDIGSFEMFYNVGFLVLHFLVFANFDSENDYRNENVTNLYKKLQSGDNDEKINRWSWLSERSVFVVRNLSGSEFREYNKAQDSLIEQIEVKNSLVTPEHILPDQIPSKWKAKIRALHGNKIKFLRDATITTFMMRDTDNEKKENMKHTYYAHARATASSADDEQLFTIESVDLGSPGEAYDEAMGMIRLAAERRLKTAMEDTVGDAEIATAYLAKLGFQVFKAKDFIHLFLSSIYMYE